MKLLKPNHFFKHFKEIDRGWLEKNNIRYILSDLDGTLAGWNENGDELFTDWVNTLKEADVMLVIVSNNSEERVKNFAEGYGLKWISNCQKPSITKIDKKLNEFKLERTKTLFLGDQLFTDVWCGNKLKVSTALITEPLGDYEPFRTSCKRWIEKILLKGKY